jgi:hypothetical protein
VIASCALAVTPRFMLSVTTAIPSRQQNWLTERNAMQYTALTGTLRFYPFISDAVKESPGWPHFAAYYQPYPWSVGIAAVSLDFGRC